MHYKTIKTVVKSELIEKKSRFICMLQPITEAALVEETLAEIRKALPGARHYCYAFRIRDNGQLMEKYSDDGEPNSTAGVPMLNVLRQKELENVLAVVVRYFGGTLLGTGGLVRAYSGAVIQSLDMAETITMEYAVLLTITMDYNYYGNFQNKCLPHFNQITDIRFADQVRIEGWISAEKLDRMRTLLDEISARSASVEDLQKDFVPQK